MSTDPLQFADLLRVLPEEADFDAVYAEVVSTQHGRWFLSEYSLRNSHGEANGRARAIPIVETVLGEEARPAIPASLLDDCRVLAATIDAVEAEVSAGGIRNHSEIAAAERIQDVAFALRERAVEPALCDALEVALGELADALSPGEAAAERAQSALLQMRRLADRIAGVVAAAATPASDEAPAEATLVAHDEPVAASATAGAEEFDEYEVSGTRADEQSAAAVAGDFVASFLAVAVAESQQTSADEMPAPEAAPAMTQAWSVPAEIAIEPSSQALSPAEPLVETSSVEPPATEPMAQEPSGATEIAIESAAPIEAAATPSVEMLSAEPMPAEPGVQEWTVPEEIVLDPRTQAGSTERPPIETLFVETPPAGPAAHEWTVPAEIAHEPAAESEPAAEAEPASESEAQPPQPQPEPEPALAIAAPDSPVERASEESSATGAAPAGDVEPRDIDFAGDDGAETGAAEPVVVEAILPPMLAAEQSAARDQDAERLQDTAQHDDSDAAPAASAVESAESPEIAEGSLQSAEGSLEIAEASNVESAEGSAIESAEGSTIESADDSGADLLFEPAPLPDSQALADPEEDPADLFEPLAEPPPPAAAAPHHQPYEIAAAPASPTESPVPLLASPPMQERLPVEPELASSQPAPAATSAARPTPIPALLDPRDPLTAIRALSDDELIALFS